MVIKLKKKKSVGLNGNDNKIIYTKIERVRVWCAKCNSHKEPIKLPNGKRICPEKHDLQY